MNVAIIGSFEGYHHMGNWVADGWRVNGHEVTIYDRNIKKYSQAHDLYLFVDCSEDYSGRIPDIKKPKVFWSMDVHMPGGIERSTNIARKCDLVFSSNYEHGVKILEKFGIKSYLLPITYSDTLIDWSDNTSLWPEKKELDVVMIGHPNSNERLALWEMIKTNYPNSFLGIAKTEEEYKMYMKGARIIINQPTEPWDIILNNRFFEGLASGAVLMQKHLKTDLIEKMGFIPGKDFIYWDTFKGLKRSIDKVLKDRNGLGSYAQKKVKQYSLASQCAKMESIILSQLYERL